MIFNVALIGINIITPALHFLKDVSVLIRKGYRFFDKCSFRRLHYIWQCKVGVANLENICGVIYGRTLRAMIFRNYFSLFYYKSLFQCVSQPLQSCQEHFPLIFTKTFYSVLTKDIHSTLYLIATAATTTTVATATTAATAATL